MTYTVIGKTATRTLRVLWMLEELGQPYAHEPTAPASDAARVYNPSGKVPVLLDGDLSLTDSVAILTYLADKHGTFTHPSGTAARGLQDSLTFQILDEIEALVWMSARHSFVLPPEQRLPEIKPSLKWEFQRNQARLAERLAGAFLMGETMTVPDFLLAHCLAWAQSAKFPEVDPRLRAYQDRLYARPAAQRALAR